MVLNLDKAFTPFPTEKAIAFESFEFAGGEPHIKISSDIPDGESVIITHRLNSFNDVGLLCVTVDALRRMGVRELEIFIPYFPAARQDRVMIKGEPLSVKVYADLINGMKPAKVTVFDPHSEVTPALLENCNASPNYDFIKKVIAEIGTTPLLIAPDGGALKKIYKVSHALGHLEVVECSKSRDVKTGKLSGFKVNADDLEGKPCLIVDDICDGGNTFIGLAAELKNKKAGKLYLAVSHGIFSNGFDVLAGTFEKIFTTDSIRTFDHPSVTQLKFQNGLLVS